MRPVKENINSSKLSIITLQDEPRADSRVLAEGLGIKHRNLMENIRKYEGDLSGFGHLPFKTEVGERIQGGGKAEIYALLNEDQAYFVLTLSRNTPKVVSLKKKLVKEFGRLRKKEEQRAALSWQQARLEGKDARRHETDAIQEFVEYATAQGSKSAKLYYMNITKMTHRTLFFVEQGLKSPNGLRDMLDGMQLSFLTTAEYVCAKALRDGIEMKMEYKDIYLLAKQRVESFSTTVGKTPLLTH